MAVDAFGLLRSNIVVVKMNGGLGNQMFQYAAARALSGNFIYYDLFNLKVNNSTTDTFTARSFELEIFPNLIGAQLNSIQEKLFNSRKFFFKLLRNLTFGRIALVKQKGAEFITFPKANNILLHGFFQSEKYFSSHREALLHEFSFPELDVVNKNLLSRIQSIENAVSIHVRRGDYLKPKVKEYHGILPAAYYQKSIALLESDVTNPTYFIFSDDPLWCKENLSHLNNVEIVVGNTGGNAWKDMCLMSHCKHHIVANSSFSWWGAWLSKSVGIKLAPTKWFNPAIVNFTINDIVPDWWKVVYYD